MKNTVYKPLITPYESKMNKDTPWEDYPRPELVRESYMTLNGKWDFAIADEGEPESYCEQILVPFPPESRLSGVERQIPKGKYLHYSKVFTLPEGLFGERIILHIGTCDAICTVFVNGVRVAYHEGGYLPFSADVTDALTDGVNKIYIRAYDELSPIYPYGKQKRKRGGMWYTPVSGIWQSVWLEGVPKNYISGLRITTDTKSAKIEVLGGEDRKKLTLSGGEIYEWAGACIEIAPDSPRLWSPEDPFLYEFEIECGKDKIRSYFALREIGVREIDGIPRLTLNGEPYLFNGLLDQGYYPDGIFLPATVDGYLDDILLCKKMGFNTLRKHIKIEPAIFYYLCDKHGVAVFQDMVNK